MTTDWHDWLIPALSFVTFVCWIVVALLSMPLIASRTAPPPLMRLVTLAACVLVSGALTLSSLVRPGAITVDAGRFVVDVARVVLFAGGVLAAWSLLRHRRGML